MPLFLTHHPWPGGSMPKEDILKLIRSNYENWVELGVQWQSFMGTPQDGEGWCLFRAPDSETLTRALVADCIPYLYVHRVWQVSEADLGIAKSAGISTSTAPRSRS